MPVGRQMPNPLMGANQVVRGTVLEIDENNVALVNMSTGQQERVRADMLRGKSLSPRPGETWIFDQPYGSGWMFAIPMGHLGGDQDFAAPTFTNGWSDAGDPYQPVGYISDAEGWVTCRGRITGGTANQAAFTLPSGYRPPGRLTVVACVGSATGIVLVASNGNVIPVSGGDTSLEQVRFLASH